MSKDANDLRQDFIAAGVSDEAQQARVDALIASSGYVVQLLAEQVGDPSKGNGAMVDPDARRKGIVQVAYMTQMLAPEDRALHEKALAKAMGMLVTDFRNVVKTQGNADEDENEDKYIDPIYTAGGWIAGHLVELIYDEKDIKTRFAIRFPDGHIGMRDKLVIERQIYYPMKVNTMIFKKVVRLPSDLVKPVSDEELLEKIRDHNRKYFDFAGDDSWEMFSGFYPIFSWIYDGFTSLPYLRMLGDSGTGKSRFLKTVGLKCYRAVYTTAGSSAAALFRTLDIFRGTLVLDEGDFKDSSEASMIGKILNGGYERGVPIMRTGKDADGNFDVEAFDVYGPKVIGMRKDFQDDAIASRCITKETVPMPPDPRIPQYLPPEFDQELEEIMNLLLAHRMKRAQENWEVDQSKTDHNFEPRVNQVTLGLMTAFPSEAMQKNIELFRTEYNEQVKGDRYETATARVLEGIMRAYAWGPASDHPADQDRTYLKDIADATNAVIDEQNQRMGDDSGDSDGKEKRWTSRGISASMKKFLNIQTRRATDGSPEYKGTAYVKWDTLRIEGLCKRWNVEMLERGSVARPIVKHVDFGEGNKVKKWA